MLFILTLHKIPGKALGAPLCKIFKDYKGDKQEYLLPHGIELSVKKVCFNVETNIHEVHLSNKEVEIADYQPPTVQART